MKSDDYQPTDPLLYTTDPDDISAYLRKMAKQEQDLRRMAIEGGD
jgi:hypothetical protein